MSIKNNTFVWFVRGVTKTLNLDLTKPVRKPSGRWQSPRVSKLQLARIRREVLDNGQTWPFEKEHVNHPVKFKGSIDLLKRQKKFDYIKAKLEEQPAKIEEYKKNLIANRKHRTDPIYILHNGIKGRRLK